MRAAYGSSRVRPARWIAICMASRHRRPALRKMPVDGLVRQHGARRWAVAGLLDRFAFTLGELLAHLGELAVVLGVLFFFAERRRGVVRLEVFLAGLLVHLLLQRAQIYDAQLGEVVDPIVSARLETAEDHLVDRRQIREARG